MAGENLYQDLKDELQKFKDFLHANIGDIQKAVQAVRTLFPKIDDLLKMLIDLMGKIKDEINKLDPNAIPGVSQISTFTQNVTSLLQAAKNLLPNEASTIDDVLAVASVVSGLPTLGQLKTEILSLIDAIVADLNQLKS